MRTAHRQQNSREVLPPLFKASDLDLCALFAPKHNIGKSSAEEKSSTECKERFLIMEEPVTFKIFITIAVPAEVLIAHVRLLTLLYFGLCRWCGGCGGSWRAGGCGVGGFVCSGRRNTEKWECDECESCSKARSHTLIVPYLLERYAHIPCWEFLEQTFSRRV